MLPTTSCGPTTEEIQSGSADDLMMEHFASTLFQSNIESPNATLSTGSNNNNNNTMMDMNSVMNGNDNGAFDLDYLLAPQLNDDLPTF
ncbi:hypothetical protein ABK040_006175 [Willaertia magna]